MVTCCPKELASSRNFIDLEDKERGDGMSLKKKEKGDKETNSFMIKDADAGERIRKNVLMSNCFRVKSGECELICVGWAVGATTCAYGNDRCAFACGTYCGQAYIAKSPQYRFLISQTTAW
jgi:hypothetical protein